MRWKPAIIVSFGLLAAPVAWVISRSEPSTAPDVKVTCAARTPTSTEFLVANRSSRPIRLTTIVSIEQAEPAWMGNRVQFPLSGDPVIGPSSSQGFQVPWTPPGDGSRWRALFTLHWDAPGERLIKWLQSQSFWRRLPPRLVERQVEAYEFGSPWLE